MKWMVGAVLAFAAATASAAEVKVLSAGAVEPGLHDFANVVRRESGHALRIQFNTVPQIAKRLAAGEVYDILIAAPAVIRNAAGSGKVIADTEVPVGRVGVGIIVRRGAKEPDVGTADELKSALLGADSIVYNTASSGLYLDQLFGKMGILDAIRPKTTRFPDGASVMEHVIHSKGNEIGFGQITEIRTYEPKGLRLVGPLPAEVQNYTIYHAAVMSGAPNEAAARAVLKLLVTPVGREAFARGGVEEE